MEDLTTLITDNISQYISVSYLIAVIFLSYGLRNIVTVLIGAIVKDKNAKMYSVFIIATVLGLIWAAVFKENLMKLLVTYAVATSMYELVIKAIIEKLTPKK